MTRREPWQREPEEREPRVRWTYPRELRRWTDSSGRARVTEPGTEGQASWGPLTVWSFVPDDGSPSTFQISFNHSWMPGIFDSEVAARYGARFPDASLMSLQEAANAREGRERSLITMEDLRAERSRLEKLLGDAAGRDA